MRSFRAFLADSLFGTLIKERIAEATVASYTKDDNPIWQKITGDLSRDLNPIQHERMLKIVDKLNIQNPLAKHLINITASFTTGDGISFAANDERVQVVLDRHWNDRRNRWPLKHKKRVKELGLYGEQLWAVTVNPIDGFVTVFDIDVARIKRLVRSPHDLMSISEVILKESFVEGGGKSIEVINPDVNGVLHGECFLHRVNNTIRSTRGVSDLIASADWLDAYDRMMFDSVDSASLRNATFLDVSVDGDEKTVKEVAASFTAPSPGAVRVHNSRVTVTQVAPNLGANEIATESKLIKGQIAISHSLPPHFVGDGMDVNRATASEMSDPTLRVLQDRRDEVSFMFEDLGVYVIQQAQAHGELPGGMSEDDLKFTVQMPDLTSDATSQQGAFLVQNAQALTMALGQGLMTRKTAIESLSVAYDKIGVTIDVEHEMEELDKEINSIFENDPEPNLKQEPVVA